MAKENPHRYTSQQLILCTRNYFHKLGSGGFGIVYRGLLPEGIPVAVKVLNNNITKQVEEQFMAEVNSIGRTYHHNLVKLYGYCFEPKLKALVYEFMPNSPRARPEMSVVVKMLEGGMEVPLPPNPFAYLEETFEFGVDDSNGATDITTFSSSEQDGEIQKCETFPRVEERRIDIHFESC